MWDSHFRVGGGAGTDLLLEVCPVRAKSVNEGYHDLESPLNGEAHNGEDDIPANVRTEISIYAGRGVRIESWGPTWLWGCGSEHTQLYQWQLLSVANIYLGHMKTDTPYYQPNPTALEPYTIGEDDCQISVVDTNYPEGVWIYNIFMKGSIEIVSPEGGIRPLLLGDTLSNGYTSEAAAWLVLALKGNIGSDPDEDSGSGVVFIDLEIWDGAAGIVTIQCSAHLTYVLPPLSLPEPTAITFPPYTTLLEVGWFEPTEYKEAAQQLHRRHIEGETLATIRPTRSVLPPLFTITDDPDPEDDGTSNPVNTREITPPPWPWPSDKTPPPTTTTSTEGDDDDDDEDDVDFPVIIHTNGLLKPSCKSGCGKKGQVFCDRPCLLFCPSGNFDFDSWDSNDPNSSIPSNGPEPTECKTSTFSSCRTHCTAVPTSTCTSTRSDVLGRDTTGTEIAATITPAPAGPAEFEQWDTSSLEFADELSVAQSVLDYIVTLAASILQREPQPQPQPPATSRCPIRQTQQ
ncbi:hypothetical protein AJ80_05035 [Polytolypa hystricis UAMH7299]|uniref:Uncharacterized protein n=1 Tax=Polytolypa hystricis (strain UAMH7299) TaxID=1447883 RepID=A0A2B7Y763_POLH7|nr:hypothetical protein AJ80_05035 [Polytolypa hystricis UAMH7299]